MRSEPVFANFNRSPVVGADANLRTLLRAEDQRRLRSDVPHAQCQMIRARGLDLCALRQRALPANDNPVKVLL